MQDQIWTGGGCACKKTQMCENLFSLTKMKRISDVLAADTTSIASLSGLRYFDFFANHPTFSNTNHSAVHVFGHAKIKTRADMIHPWSRSSRKPKRPLSFSTETKTCVHKFLRQDPRNICKGRGVLSRSICFPLTIFR